MLGIAGNTRNNYLIPDPKVPNFKDIITQSTGFKCRHGTFFKNAPWDFVVGTEGNIQRLQYNADTHTASVLQTLPGDCINLCLNDVGDRLVTISSSMIRIFTIASDYTMTEVANLNNTVLNCSMHEVQWLNDDIIVSHDKNFDGEIAVEIFTYNRIVNTITLKHQILTGMQYVESVLVDKDNNIIIIDQQKIRLYTWDGINLSLHHTLNIWSAAGEGGILNYYKNIFYHLIDGGGWGCYLNQYNIDNTTKTFSHHSSIHYPVFSVDNKGILGIDNYNCLFIPNSTTDIPSRIVKISSSGMLDIGGFYITQASYFNFTNILNNVLITCSYFASLHVTRWATPNGAI